ncbi:MAG: RNA polymerase recycling motor HelD [Eubacteriales bacterium]|nr:RNA polymerase recycling motor HelD [Eubacteriales bacterium]
MPIRHPAAQEEQAHLEETLVVIEEERKAALQEKANAEGALSHARMYDPDALPIREMLYTSALNALRSMELAAKKPYFTRIDFIETGGQKQVYYIGKHGVYRPDDERAQVIDWRAPVANLYYSGQIGPMHYVAPDGEISGELTLKRQIGIEEGQLRTIFDTDLVSQDAYLQSVLGAMTGERLREIVTTIQAEQNFVIRHPLNRTLIVQGVAGSGKTTIALHRIAYLLYAFRESLRPEQMLILAPSPLFLNFIAGVLPDLGVEQVRQSTFPLWMAQHLGSALPKIDRADRTEAVLAMDPAQLSELTRIAQAKGSARMAELLDGWLDAFEQSFCPEQGLSFGPVQLYTRAQLEQFLLVDEKPFPMQRRMREFEKQLRAAAKAAAKRINDWLVQECDKRAQALRVTVKDPKELRAKLDALFASRDARLKQTLEQVRPYVKAALSSFPELSPAALYRRFWEDMLRSPEADVALAARHTCTRFEQGLAPEAEDVAPLAIIAMRLVELPRVSIRHIVVDEAQDFSPLEFAVLRRIAPSATMTIVGDMMQGVHGWRGLQDWAALREGIFGGKAVMHHLLTSYRSTIEIMSFASRVAQNRPVPGQQLARPVLRHGEEPRILRFASAAEKARAIAQTAERWRAEGCSTVAVIGRDERELRALLRKMPASLQAHLLDPEQEEYSGGVVLAHAGAVKGLEFDGVILADADAQRYPERDLDARLLYVCCTRALHRLLVCHCGELSPLLCPVDPEN